MSDEEKVAEILQKAFSEFRGKYRPITPDEKDVEMKKTTDLEEMFGEFTGLEITRFEMADLMQQNNFTFKLIGDEFFWLMMEV